MGDSGSDSGEAVAFYDSNEFDDHHVHDHHHDTLFLSIYWTTVLGLCLSVVCVFGILGNIFSSIVLSRSDMRSSTKYILLALTFFDGVLLLSYLATFILYAVEPFDGHHTHVNVGWFYYLHTQFLYPICQTAYTGSVYAIVLVTLERYVAVCWPLLLNRVLTRRAAIGAVVGLFLFSTATNAPLWLELLNLHPVTYIDEETNEPFVEYEQLHHNWYYVLYYHGVFWITIMYGIPFLVLAVFNFLIWKEVRETNVKRANLSINASGSEISVTKMLLTVIGVFVVCNAVNCSLVIIFVLRTGEHHAYNIGIFVAIPLIINSSVNIVIYCAKGKSFRTQFMKLLRSIAWCKRIRRTVADVRHPHSKSKPGSAGHGAGSVLGKTVVSGTSSSASAGSTTTKSTISSFGSTKKLDKPTPFPLRAFPAMTPYIVYVIKDPSVGAGTSVKNSEGSQSTKPLNAKVDEGVQAHMDLYDEIGLRPALRSPRRSPSPRPISDSSVKNLQKF